MDRGFTHGEPGFLDRLTHGGVGMDGAAEVLSAAAVFHVGDDFADEFARAVAKNLRAENPVGFGGGDDFDKTVGGAAGKGAAIGGAVGLLTGALVGNAMDQQHRERLAAHQWVGLALAVVAVVAVAVG